MKNSKNNNRQDNTSGKPLNIPVEISEGVPASSCLMNVRHIKPHYHKDGFEIIYCLSGKVSLISSYRYRNLNAGEFFMVDVGEIHTLSSDADNVTLLVQFGIRESDSDYDAIKRGYFDCESRLKIPGLQESIDHVADLALAFAYASNKSSDVINQADLYWNMRNFILKNFTWIKVSDLTPEENEKYAERLQGILRYVDQHYMEKITLAQLSEMFYINENYLSRFLRKTTMEHLHLLVWFCRCCEAEEMLAFTDKKATDISSICGFSSPQYFYKYFSHFYKITPLQYRKRLESLCAMEDDCKTFTNKKTLSYIQKYIAERKCLILAGKPE